MEEEAAVALTIPALVAERIATHANDIVLRKKDHGIWKATTWAQLGARVREVGTGLKAVGFRPGDVACVLAETRPEWVHIDLGILGAGGVSGGIHPEQEAEPLGQALRDALPRAVRRERGTARQGIVGARPLSRPAPHRHHRHEGPARLRRPDVRKP